MYSPADFNGAGIAEMEWKLEEMKKNIRVYERMDMALDILEIWYGLAGESVYSIRSMRGQTKNGIKSPDQKIIVGYLGMHPELMERGDEKTVAELCEKFGFKGARTRRSIKYLAENNILPFNRNLVK